MSSDRSDLQLRSSRTGGWGSACCILLLVCRTEVWSSVNKRRIGRVVCVTRAFCRCSAWTGGV